MSSGLRLVEADHEGRQPEADPPILLVQPDQAATDQPEQRPADLPDRLAGPGGNRLHRFRRPRQEFRPGQPPGLSRASPGSGLSTRTPSWGTRWGAGRGPPPDVRRDRCPSPRTFLRACRTWMAVTMTARGGHGERRTAPVPPRRCRTWLPAVIGWQGRPVGGRHSSGNQGAGRSTRVSIPVSTRPRFAADRRPGALGERPAIGVTSCRHVRHRVLWQPGGTSGKAHVAGSIAPAQVAGQRHADDRAAASCG